MVDVFLDRYDTFNMLSGKLSDLIKRHEGLSLITYRCPAGSRTIGYGHNLDANPLHRIDRYIDHYLAATGKITQDMAEWILDQDILHAGIAAEQITPIWYALNYARRAVVISMIFNLGVQGYTKFQRMRAALNNAMYQEAADEMRDSDWYYQVGPRAEELAQMMETGEWT